ncbi:uncharacterized protein LOC120404802 isoform X2 [Mauremys reevesii]|uniref:uncharacterized protein LOC120404802 isoform X2 n=1 Tax=Mauremys reevesii TaxID=260615 RepID=UPI00193FF5CF|nr:uncharacterized protein LOC120404802 isoform X2 [Mauremys reevesii]
MRGRSSCSCRPSTWTRWSRAAARRLWWRGLCIMKPALEPDLETHLLRAALHCIFTLGTEKDTINSQHVNLWMVSRVSQERARAIRSSTALLRYAVTLPEFDISAEFPRMDHHVAQLALFVSDPDKDISQQAREGTYRLYQLLLQQRGLTIHEAEDLWCHDWPRDSRLLGYKNTARVKETRPGNGRVSGPQPLFQRSTLSLS